MEEKKSKFNLKEAFSAFAKDLTGKDPDAAANAEHILDAALSMIDDFDPTLLLYGGHHSKIWPWDRYPAEMIPAILAIFLTGKYYVNRLIVFQVPSKENIHKFCARYCRNPNLEAPIRIRKMGPYAELNKKGTEWFEDWSWGIDFQKIDNHIFMFFGADKMYSFYDREKMPKSLLRWFWFDALTGTHLVLDLEGSAYITMPKLEKVMYSQARPLLRDCGFRIAFCDKNNPPPEYDLKIDITEWSKFYDDDPWKKFRDSSDPVKEEDKDKSDS